MMVDESRFHAAIPGEMGNPSISRGADALKRLERVLQHSFGRASLGRQEASDIVSYVDYLLERLLYAESQKRVD